MRFLIAVAAMVANAAAAQDAPIPLSDAIASFDNTNISASGAILYEPLSDLIWFEDADGERYRTELALDRSTLEKIENECVSKGLFDGGCRASITGAVRIKGDFFQILIDSVTSLTPVD